MCFIIRKYPYETRPDRAFPRLLFLITVCLLFLSVIPAKAETNTNTKKDAKAKNVTWKVTQYGRADDAHQSMFYTICSSTGKLMVIDGGWVSQADHVRNVIAGLGNRVDAWVITHPHPDHVGALNAILKNNYTGIRIRKIYAPQVNAVRYAATKQPWDDYQVYEEFASLTKGMKKLKYLKEGDKLKVIGLTMTVFNGWDSSVDKLSVNFCNQGSLVFRLEGKKRSMLFCADVGQPRQKRILKKYKKQIRSTYVQCGHHGNWGLTKTFYKYVAPKAAFFDAPALITMSSGDLYDAPALIAYFRRKNVRVYMFGNGTHSVKLK